MKSACRRLAPILLFAAAIGLRVPATARAQEVVRLQVYDKLLANTYQHYHESQKVYLFGIPARPLGTLNAHKRWVESFLRDGGAGRLLLEFLRSEHWKILRETSQLSWKDLEQIPLDALERDLKESRYIFRKSCAAGEPGGPRKRKQASTGFSPGDAVCFHPGMLVRSLPYWDELTMQARLAALVLHEHLHHFGITDSSNWIYEAIQTFILRWKRDDSQRVRTFLVSREFAEARQRFRDARADLPPRSAVTYACRFHERVDSIDSAYREQLLPLIREWFAAGFSIRPSPIGAGRWEFRNSLIGRSKFRLVPMTFRRHEHPLVDALVTGGFGVYSEQGSERDNDVPEMVAKGYNRMVIHELLAQANAVLRVEADGTLLFELSQPNAAEVGYPTLPSAAFNDSQATGYAVCSPGGQ